MINYKWNFPAFDCIVKDGDMEKIVKTVHWVYIGENENGVTVTNYGTQELGEPNPEAFTSYPDISEKQVIEWMEETMDIKSMQENIAAQIELIVNPIVVTLPPPFNN